MVHPMLLSLVCSTIVLLVAVLADPEPNQEDLHIHLHGLDKVGENTKMNISGEAPETEGGQDYHGGSGGIYPSYGGWKICLHTGQPLHRTGCTGSLISSTVVLTATHCFYDKYGRLNNPSCGHVVFNSDDKISGNDNSEIKVKIKKIVRFNYDLAVAILEKKVSLKPVRIARRPVRNGAKVRALGYGMEGFRKGGKYLNEIKLKVRNQDATPMWSKIEKRWTRWNWIETNVGPNNEGPCPGDSGGPLLVWRNNRWELLATLYGGGYNCEDNTSDRMGDLWNSIIGSGVFRGRHYAYGQYNCK